MINANTKIKQRGVALLQVLLVSMILSLLAIYISKTAQWQVASATSATEKVQALLEVRSVHSKLAYTLATAAPEELRKGQYNFHGKVFELDNVRVEIQDLNGLISLPLETQPKTLEKLFQYHGASESQAQTIANRIVNYMKPTQSSAENTQARPILYLDELRNIAQGYDELIDKAARDITFQVTPSLNPLTATEGVIAALTNETIARNLVSQRESSLATAQQIKSQAGLYVDERLSYSIGPGFRVRVTAEVGDTFVRRERTLWINANDQRKPIQIVEQKPDY